DGRHGHQRGGAHRRRRVRRRRELPRRGRRGQRQPVRVTGSRAATLENVTSPEREMKYDVMVVGSGIAGMESSIKLGDMGYKVLLVEKEASVGGRMILLSKVFPTLDCASCISGPKMSTTINHPNIHTMTYSEVQGI